MTDARRGARRLSPGGWSRRTACVLAVGTLLTTAGCSSVTAIPETVPVTTPAAPPSPSPAAPVVTPVPPLVASDPVRVVIPALGLDEPLIDLGLAADGAMEVPADYDEVGWFTGGGRPGGTGPTVIAAHVDSPTGPAVFRALKDLGAGDVVEVQDADGRTHSYRVTETADYPKSAFPTARVFGATPRDELRLITCGGVFDRDAGSYVDNRVVYAEPA